MTRHRPAKCPRCGSERTASILYDLDHAGASARDDIRLRRAVVRGRSADGNDPRWICFHCGLEWGHPRGISGLTPGRENLA